MRSNHVSVPYTPVYSKENVMKKGVRFGTRAVVDAGISSSQQPFSRYVRNLLMGSFDDIISACAYSWNFMLAEQLMLQIQILGLEPSTHTYNGYIRALLSWKSFHDGMELLNVMQQKILKPSDSTLAALSISCSRSLQLDLAETNLDQVSKGSIDVIVFNEFLKACDYVDKPERTIRTRSGSRMKEKNLKGDITTYVLLFSLFGCVNAAYDTPTIKSQAEVAKKINAIEMDMTKNGIQHDLHSLRNLGRIGVTELIIEKMHRTKIQPDTSTCHHVFNAYTTTGFHSTAMEAPQVVSMRMISEDARVLEKYRLKYENLILDEEKNFEFEIMEMFTESSGLVAALLSLKMVCDSSVAAILVTRSKPVDEDDSQYLFSSTSGLMDKYVQDDSR